MFGFSSTPYRYRPRSTRAAALAQWQMVALAVAWLLIIGATVTVMVHQ